MGMEPVFKTVDEAKAWVIGVLEEHAKAHPETQARNPETGEIGDIKEILEVLKFQHAERKGLIASRVIDPRFHNDLMQDETYRIAATKWMRGLVDRPFRTNGEYKRAADYLLKFETNEDRCKDWDAATAGSGGSFVPTGFLREVWSRAGVYNQLRLLATVFPVTGKIQAPTGTGRPTSYWPGENTAPESQATGITTGSINLDPQELVTYLILSNKLFMTSGIDLTDFLARKFTEGLAYEELNKMTNGDGDGCPKGFANHTAYASVTAVSLETAGTLAFNDLTNLEFALGQEYVPFASYMVSRKALKTISKLQDENKMPVWTRNVEGRPSLINGYPYVVNPLISEAIEISGVNRTEIYFGDWAAYYVAMLQDLKFAVSDTAGDAFIKEQLYVKLVEYVDGQLADQNGLVYLTGVNV